MTIKPPPYFGVICSNAGVLYLSRIGHRGGIPGWWTALVINGNWYCRVVFEGHDAPFVQCSRPHQWKQRITAVYFPPKSDPLPGDYNAACALIEARAKPL